MKGIYKVGLAIALAALLMSSTKKSGVSAVVKNQKLRECDPAGCGNFGASRGSRKHYGVDIITVPGEQIYAPISGKVTRHSIPYASSNDYKGIEITGEKYTVKIFYAIPLMPVGKTVNAGDWIATAQDITKRYTSNMTNHVHVEFYDKSTKEILDPTEILKL